MFDKPIPEIFNPKHKAHVTPDLKVILEQLGHLTIEQKMLIVRNIIGADCIISTHVTTNNELAIIAAKMQGIYEE